MVPLISRDVTNGLRYTRVSRAALVLNAAVSCKPERTVDRKERGADEQDCECDEGCYYCMVILKLKASYFNGQQGQFMSVTSDMLEIVPSPGGVSRLFPFAGRLPNPCPWLVLLVKVMCCNNSARQRLTTATTAQSIWASA